MFRKIQCWLLVSTLVLLSTQVTAAPPLRPQDEDVPDNGCVIYNPTEYKIGFSLRNMKDGSWQMQELGARSAKAYIEKDYILLGRNQAKLDLKRKYCIVWNPWRGGLDVQPI